MSQMIFLKKKGREIFTGTLIFIDPVTGFGLVFTLVYIGTENQSESSIPHTPYPAKFANAAYYTSNARELVMPDVPSANSGGEV
jgi:hypothetical protein